MFFSQNVFLRCCILLKISVDASPFVLLSGVDALPDDDLKTTGRGPSFHAPHALGSFRRQADYGSLAMRSLPPLRAVNPYSQMPGRRIADGPLNLMSTAEGDAPSAAQSAFGNRLNRCYDVRKEVLVESGLQGHADVFSSGLTTPQWDPSSTSSSGSSSVVLPPAEQAAVFVVRTGKGVGRMKAQVAVSNPSILAVDLTDDGSSGTKALGQPSILLSKHRCKASGVATVVIELLLQQDKEATLETPLCPGPPAPVVFAYQKACAAPSRTLNTFWKAWGADVAAQERRFALSKARAEPKKPWSGIIPSGGVRTVFLVVLILALIIILYEFGMFYISNQIKDMLIDLGPVMFGCRITIHHCSMSMLPHRMVFTLEGMQFANPEGGEYIKEYFMNIEEVKVRFNLAKLMRTCGGVIEIRELLARHIQANVEKDGVLLGHSNISKVMTQMEKNQAAWRATLVKIQEERGIDAAKLWDDFAAWIRKVAERVTLQEVLLEGIGYTVSNRAFGMEMQIADMKYSNFSVEHNAVGVPAIGYYLTHAVLEGFANDVGGVEFGHGRFEGVVKTVKRLSSKLSGTGEGEYVPQTPR